MNRRGRTLLLIDNKVVQQVNYLNFLGCVDLSCLGDIDLQNILARFNQLNGVRKIQKLNFIKLWVRRVAYTVAEHGHLRKQHTQNSEPRFLRLGTKRNVGIRAELNVFNKNERVVEYRNEVDNSDTKAQENRILKHWGAQAVR